MAGREEEIYSQMPPEEDVLSILDSNIFSPVAIGLGPEADAQTAHLRARRAAHAHVGRLHPLFRTLDRARRARAPLVRRIASIGL